MTVGERMKRRRKELGISADEIASYIGVDRTTYYRYERGAISKVSADVLQRIAQYLHTTPIWLMGMENALTTSDRNTDSSQIHLTDDEAFLLSAYRKLDEGDRGEIRGEIKIMLRADKYKSKIKNDEAI